MSHRNTTANSRNSTPSLLASLVAVRLAPRMECVTVIVGFAFRSSGFQRFVDEDGRSILSSKPVVRNESCTISNTRDHLHVFRRATAECGITEADIGSPVTESVRRLCAVGIVSMMHVQIMTDPYHFKVIGSLIHSESQLLIAAELMQV
jgi:hypothetical protein